MGMDPLASWRSSAARLTRREALGLAGAAAAGGLAATALHPAAASASGTLHVARSPAQTPRTQLEALDARIREAMAESGVPGAAIGVLYRGEEYLAGYGITNVDYPLPVDADTLFQIGSVTKTFTMAAAMRLVDQGRLELDAPLRRYLPDLQLSDPEATARITMRHLLTHTSGLPRDDFATMGGGDDALARFVAQQIPRLPLMLPLGLYPSYSNAGISLAGRVIEAVSGRTYEAAIGELLFEPLGMARATFFADEAILAATTAGHVVLDGRAYVARPWPIPRTSNPAGAIVASVRDVLRYVRWWLRDGVGPDGTRLLTPATLAEIGTPQARDPADLWTFGLGWQLQDAGGVTFWAHDGGTFGQNSRLRIAPGHDVAFCALTNAVAGDAVLEAVTAWVEEQLLGISVAPRPAPSPLARDAAALAAYVGAYENPGTVVFALRVRDGGLEVDMENVNPALAQIQPQQPPSPALRLAFSAPDAVYAVEAPAVRGMFRRHSDGRIAGLFWGGLFGVRRD